MKNNIRITDKVLLFDFDGTLVETEILAREVIAEHFMERGWGDSGPYADMIVGKTWRLAVEEMRRTAKQSGLDLGSPESLEQELKRRYQERFQRGVNLIPGFKELLPLFKTKARFLGIVTGSERHEVEAILKTHQLDGVFDRVWGFGDYPGSKPDPSPYLTAMQEIPAHPAEVLVFEDSRAGMDSAHRAGLKWVQISHEAHARIPDPRSLFVIENWHQLGIEQAVSQNSG
jgi:HAD superfamily hydrolase (TIGR01509 family)